MLDLPEGHRIKSSAKLIRESCNRYCIACIYQRSENQNFDECVAGEVVARLIWQWSLKKKCPLIKRSRALRPTFKKERTRLLSTPRGQPFVCPVWSRADVSPVGYLLTFEGDLLCLLLSLSAPSAPPCPFSALWIYTPSLQLSDVLQVWPMPPWLVAAASALDSRLLLSPATIWV